MMNKLKFNSQVCTTKIQSQRLLDLGLKPETADCYNREEEYGFSNWIGKPSLPTDTTAWSLHRLLCMLYTREDVYLIMPTTAYDDIIDDIETEIKCGGFNKQYLNE